MSTNLPQIDSHPYYNSSSFATREALDTWKAIETKDVHDLLKKIDDQAYQVFEMSEKSKMMLTGKTRIRIKVVKARNLTGKDKTGKSDPYCTIEYDKEIFSTKVIDQNLEPVWDEQITLFASLSSCIFRVLHLTLVLLSFSLLSSLLLLKLFSTLKDPKGKIVLQVWDKDPEDEVKAFSSKFWKEETDDFLGMVKQWFCLSGHHSLLTYFDPPPPPKKKHTQPIVHLSY